MRVFIRVFLLLGLGIGQPAWAQWSDGKSLSSPQEKLKAIRPYIRHLINKERYDSLIMASHQAIRWAEQANNDTLRALYQYYIGAGYEYTNRNDSAIYYYQLSEQTARHCQHQVRQVNAQIRLVDLYVNVGDVNKLNQLLPQLESLSTQVSDPELLASVLTLLGNYYQTEHQYERAIGYMLKALKPAQQQNDPTTTGVLLLNIGNTYWEAKQYAKALSYSKEAIPFLKDYQHGLAMCYYNIGTVFQDTHQPDSALWYFQKAIDIAQPADDQDVLVGVYRDLGNMYLSQKQYDQARHYLQLSLNLSQSLRLYQQTIKNMLGLAELAYQEDEYAVSRKYGREALALAAEIRNQGLLRDAYQLLARVEAALKSYERAYEYQRLYVLYQDSLQTESASRSIAEMEARYQTEKKSQQIALLHQENQTKNLQLQVQQRNQTLLWAGIGLSALIAGLLWRGYQLKRKTSRQLDEKNQALQRSNEQLESLNGQLQQANQAKAKLFSILSHDLRTPISSLFQLVQLQQTNPVLLSPQQGLEHQRRITQSAEHLLETLEDLLLWSKSQLDYLTPASEPVVIEELLTETERLYQATIEQKRLQLLIECPPGLCIRSDANYLRLIVRNLLSNAIQYSPEGVMVRLRAQWENGHASLLIEDKGPGLSASQLAGLREHTLRPGATSGLGLPLVQEFAEKLGGQLIVECPPEGGTRLGITFAAVRMGVEASYFG